MYRTLPAQIGRTTSIVQGGASSYKRAKEIIKDKPTRENINTWFPASVAKLRTLQPPLSSNEILSLVMDKLPEGPQRTVSAVVEHWEVEGQDIDLEQVMRKVVPAMVPKGVTNITQARKAFYAYKPFNKTIVECTTDLSELSRNLFKSEEERRLEILNVFQDIAPSTMAHVLKLEIVKYQNTKNLRDINIFTLIDGPANELPMQTDWEAAWCKPLKTNKQVNNVKVEEENEPSVSKQSGGNWKQQKQSGGNWKQQKQERPTQKRSRRCIRCRALTHSENECSMYKCTAPQTCSFCRNFYNAACYHQEADCVNQRRTEEMSKN